jgi:hypothetical protein
MSICAAKLRLVRVVIEFVELSSERTKHIEQVATHDREYMYKKGCHFNFTMFTIRKMSIYCVLNNIKHRQEYIRNSAVFQISSSLIACKKSIGCDSVSEIFNINCYPLAFFYLAKVSSWHLQLIFIRAPKEN